jgi:hypothetical protein
LPFPSFDHLAIATLDQIDCGAHSFPKGTGMERLSWLLPGSSRVSVHRFLGLLLENLRDPREMQSGLLGDVTHRQTGLSRLLKGFAANLARSLVLVSRVLKIGLRAAHRFSRFGLRFIRHLRWTLFGLAKWRPG